MKIEKKCPYFGKKGPNCVHLFEPSFQNVVLRVSMGKSSKIFPCGTFFAFLTKRLSKCPNFTKPPLPWKISGCAPALKKEQDLDDFNANIFKRILELLGSSVHGGVDIKVELSHSKRTCVICFIESPLIFISLKISFPSQDT